MGKYTKNEEDAIGKITDHIVTYFSNKKSDGKYYSEQLEKDSKTFLQSEYMDPRLFLVAIQNLKEEGLITEIESEEGNYLVLIDRVKNLMHLSDPNK